MERSSDTVAPDAFGTGDDRAVAGASSDRAGIAGTNSRARRPRRARRWLVVVVGIVVVAGVAYAVTGGKAHSYVLATARDGTVTQTIGVSGVLQPTRSWDLYFATGGTIAQLDVAAGQHVHAGQVLAVLDTRPLQTQVASAQAGVAAAQAKLDADQASPAADYATASAQTAADEDALTAAEDQLTTAQANLADATLRTPAAATVAQVNVTVGQSIGGAGGGGGGGSGAGGAGSGGSSQASVSASPQASTSAAAAATPTAGASGAAITLEDPRSFEAVGQVSDTQIAQVHLHQQALVTAAGGTGAIHGSIRAITPTPSSSGGVLTYPVEITWRGHPRGLYDGMSAQISILVAKVSGLTVPSSAVHTDGARSWVLVMQGATTRNGRARGGQATRQPIDVGPSGGGLTQVRSGLKAGEQVVLADNNAPLPSASSSSQGKTGKGSTVRKLFGG
jgi:multidrug efflux pump subunit AcrA (membrane-fusion protein)